MTALSIVTVNYNTSHLLKRCISSIFSTAIDIPLEIIIIDNGSIEGDTDNLRWIDERVKVVFMGFNSGYSKAVNEGIKHASGRFILITNPDVLYMPHSIKRMMDALMSLPRCGAVGPRTWWDEDRIFMLPFSELVTPLTYLRTELMCFSHTLRERILRRWIKRAVRYWLSKEIIEQEMLSGACIMTTKRIIDEVGGFDESFSLYFEDTDWCLRVRRRGYKLYMIPDSEIIHYYNQSAKNEYLSSQDKFIHSSELYMRKHFNKQFALTGTVARLLKRMCRRGKDIYEDIGDIATPPVFRFQGQRKRMVFISIVDHLIPSAGAFLDNDYLEIPKSLWNLLGRGRYFMRAFEFHGFRACGAWSWIKNGD